MNLLVCYKFHLYPAYEMGVKGKSIQFLILSATNIISGFAVSSEFQTRLLKNDCILRQLSTGFQKMRSGFAEQLNLVCSRDIRIAVTILVVWFARERFLSGLHQ